MYISPEDFQTKRTATMQPNSRTISGGLNLLAEKLCSTQLERLHPWKLLIELANKDTIFFPKHLRKICLTLVTILSGLLTSPKDWTGDDNVASDFIT